MTDNTSTILRRGWSVFGKIVAGTRKGPSGDRVRQLKKLQKQFGIRFLDLSLLEQALTHRSYSHVTSRTRDASNERMEFLGDSVLGLSVSQFLYLQFPDRPEGALSKMKSLLVSRKVLSEISREIGLGEYILLSGEESEMGGRDRDSILADSYEGVIGAIYLDQGYRAASRFIQDTLLASINDILKDEEHTNYKSLLQEYVQSRRLSHPVYRVHAEDGPEHEKQFVVDVVVKGEVWGQGRGKNKKDAEQAAAREAIEAHRRKSQPASRGASPRAAAPRATAAPRPGRWRTGATSPDSRPAAGEAAAAAADDPRHGVRASRELLRTAREAEAKSKGMAPAASDRRTEGRREEGRREDLRREDTARSAPGRSTPPRGEERRREGPRSTTGRPGERTGERTGERRPAERWREGRRPEARVPAGEPEAVSGPAISPIEGAIPGAEPQGSEPMGRPAGGRRRGRRGGRGRARPGSGSAGAVGAGAPDRETISAEPPHDDFSPEMQEADAPAPRPVFDVEERESRSQAAHFERIGEPIRETRVISPRVVRFRTEAAPLDAPPEGRSREAPRDSQFVTERESPRDEAGAPGGENLAPAGTSETGSDEDGFTSRRKKRVVRGVPKRR